MTGQTENKMLMSAAREALKGRWGIGIGAYVVYMLVLVPLQFIPILGMIGSLLLTGPMVVGYCIFSLALARRQEASISQLFSGFDRFASSLGAYILQTIFVMLWTLLLVIPGIIAAYSYAMTFFIIAEDASIGPMEAIKKSKEMMRGNKWKFFCLGLRFFGWALLCILTLGIGFLWLAPYAQVSYAKFYDDVKGPGIVPQKVSS